MAYSDNDIMGAKTVHLPVPKPFRVVAVAGAIGDLAAYAVSSDAEWTDERIRAEGNKIAPDQAKGIFPEFAEMPYRV